MINDASKQVIKNFKADVFVETGFFRGQTAVVVRSWDKDINIVEVEINPEYCQYGESIFKNDKNTNIIQGDSGVFLLNNIEMFREYENPVFYLDAHWDPNNWQLRNEIKNICRLKSPIIIIDDFKTPNPDGTISDRHGYDSYNGQDCDREYIEDLIKPHTDCVLYAKEPTIDGQGSGFIFVNRYYDDIVNKVNLDDFIVERLK
jgi:hypothetical protein